MIMSKHLIRTKEFGTIPLLSLQVVFSGIVPRSEVQGCYVELITTTSQLPKKFGPKHQLSYKQGAW